MKMTNNVASATTNNSGKSNTNVNAMNVNAKSVNVANVEVTREDVEVRSHGMEYSENGQVYNYDGYAMKLIPGMAFCGNVLVVGRDEEYRKIRVLRMIDNGGAWVEDYRSSYSPYVECENYSAELEWYNYGVVPETGEEFFADEDGIYYYASEQIFTSDFLDFSTVMAGASEEIWNDDEVAEARRIAKWRCLWEYTEDEIHEMLNEQYPMDVVVDAPGIRYEMDYDEAKEEMEWLESVMAKIDDKKYDSLTESDLWKIRYRLSDIRDMVNDATHEAVAVAY